MERKEGICLTTYFVNNMKVDGELGWIVKESNPSTGYFWQLTPDNSGTYEIVEEIKLHPATDAVGVPGLHMWKIKAIHNGHGSIMLEHYGPGATEPVTKDLVSLKVS